MTTENNKIIAEFMNGKMESNNIIRLRLDISRGTYSLEGLKFHSDWNWLMEVVEKIENIDKTEVQIFGDFRGYYLCYIRQYSDNKSPKDIRIETKSKIETVYNACLAFIEWYNENAA